VALGGFRETGKKQEEETSQQKRTILLDAKQVIEELTRIHILVSHTEAAERAGRCAEHAGLKAAVLDGAELLGHELGYLWAVFYAHGKQRTHFALIRAAGTLLKRLAMAYASCEAGFRHVAGVIAGACEQVSLAPFDKNDVWRLCESWHVEVVGDNEKVRSEARQLAATIWNNERIRAPAENPLMLTTLLVVRRCIGELPNRRVELYREAVRVLIRTWNTEGFDPMDLEETHVSYCFGNACWTMC
jgi:hypothetical protein